MSHNQTLARQALPLSIITLSCRPAGQLDTGGQALLGCGSYSVRHDWQFGHRAASLATQTQGAGYDK